ncbi:PepSY domain-containing protein [uncultured Thiodictyon sp.]|uniref:PepSY domain-containing protein n=1 Tax=uncultured Thiodictyon sp. TaxID=1846217 RepID=UPI0025FDB1A7|nr:PepSY domain-containing protein [uncultured Thiodictyon sp.]
MQTPTIFAVPALPTLALALALAFALGVAPGLAHGDHSPGEFGWEDGDQSYDRARRARESGQVLILEEIFKRATARFPGRVVDAELETENGVLVYELKILDAKGRLIKVHMDARRGVVLDKAVGGGKD